ncbi:MAG: sulfatase-like hydrolase/transferase [Planctomycetaceae bacterium]
MFNRGHWKKLVLTDDGQPDIGAKSQKGEPGYGLNGADEKTFATDFLTDRALEFMQPVADENRPFFLVVSLPDPHGPNTVRSPYDTRFSGMRFLPPRTFQTGAETPGWLGAGEGHPVFRGQEMAKYFGMVQCIDDNIGRMIAALKDSGQFDRTLILLTSDHGDLCYEHDRLNKGNPYEGSARVPFVARFPGRLKQGQVYSDPVGTVDITPTVMGLLNLPANPDDEGRDLSSDFTASESASSAADAGRTIFLRNAGRTAQWVAAVNARYKLILSVGDEPWLFDQQQDPDELINFYRRPDTSDVTESLARELLEYGKRTTDPYVSAPGIADSLAAILNQPVPKTDSTESPQKKTPQRKRRKQAAPDDRSE